jgi:outer membrane protein TolC
MCEMILESIKGDNMKRVIVFIWMVTVVAAFSQTNIEDLSVLDLDTACRIALERQPTLMEARHRMDRAVAGISRARAGYWPVLSVSAGASRYDPADSQAGTVPVSQSSPTASYGSGAFPGGSTDPETWYQAGVQATWMLFSGFQRKAAVAAAHFTADEMAAANLEASRQILYAVTAAYLNAQSAAEQMRIAEEDAAFNERILEEAVARRKAGGGSLSDELNFRVRANAARSTVIFAKRQLRLSRIGLATLMGLPQGNLPEKLKLSELSVPDKKTMEVPEIAQQEQIMLANRPDIRMRQAALKRGREVLRSAKSGFYPRVALSGSYDARRPDDMSFTGDDFALNAGVVISYDIFSGGLHRAQVREARAGIGENLAQLNSTRLHALRDLQSAIEQIKAAVEYLELQNVNVQYAQQNRDLTARSYNSGQAPMVRLNEAQKDLVGAQVRQMQAIISLLRARNDLNSATGEILNRHE